MKIYNVLFETNYENEEVESWISSFRNREDAVKCLNKSVCDEMAGTNYDDEYVDEHLKRDGDDFVCFYYDEACSNWKFRCTIFETELN